MVFRVVADVAGSVFFLDTADAVHELRGSRERPLAGQEVVADVGPEDAVSVLVGLVELGGELHRDRCQRRQVGEQPRLGAVGQVPVGEKDHRGAVGEGDPGRLDRRVEAVRRGASRHDGQRGFAVTSVHGQHQVGGLGLGRQTRGGAAALDVHEDQGDLQGDGQPEGLRLESHAGSAGRGDPQSTAVGGT